MSTKTIKIPQSLFRQAEIVRTKRDDGSEEMELSISSDTPYLRYDWWDDEDYYEVLDHSPGGMDTARLQAGLPMLFNHNRDEHLGRASSYELKDGKCYVKGLIWSDSPDAQIKKKDMESGALPDTSVGYQITDEGECVGAKDGIPIYKFKWSPFEFSLVTIPADITVGAGRGTELTDARAHLIVIHDQKGLAPEKKKAHTQSQQTKSMADPVITPAAENPKIDVVKERDEAVKTFKARCQRIDAWVTAVKRDDWRTVAATVANKHKDGEADFDAFRAEALNSFEGAQAAPVNTEIGMSRKEIATYSLARAIYRRGTGKPLENIEKEASDAQAKLLGKDADGFFIPEDVVNRSLQEARGVGQSEMVRTAEIMERIARLQSRTLTAGNFTSAGALVGIELLSGSLIELLRNKQLFANLGMTSIGGLVGNIAIPRQSGGATAYWLPEGGSVTPTDQSFQQLGLTPHRLVAQTAYDKQLVAQASLSVEAIVRNDIALVMAIRKDLAKLTGAGTAGEPLGIANTTGVQTVTFGAAATWAKILEFETDLATANADQTGTPVWLTSPGVRGKWKGTAIALTGATTVSSAPLWSADNRVNGYDAYVSNQIPATGTGANFVYFGVPSEVIDAMWAGIDVVVNPFSLDSTGQIRVTVTEFSDSALRHAPAWIQSTDSGAQ